MFPLLAASQDAGSSIEQQSYTLLGIYGGGGAWIIAALILASVFWKAGEERWKAYIPFYNWVVLFRIGALRGALVWLSAVAAVFYALGLLAAGDEANLGLALSLQGIGLVASIVFAVYYYMAVYRVAVHLGHEGNRWIALTVIAPWLVLIICAADKSMWRDTQETSLWRRGRIGTEVPRDLR